METVYSQFSSKGQVVIPIAIREALGIEAGTRVAIRQEGTKVVLEPDTLALRLRQIEELRGMNAGGPSMSDMLVEDRRLDKERSLRKFGF